MLEEYQFPLLAGQNGVLPVQTIANPAQKSRIFH